MYNNCGLTVITQTSNIFKSSSDIKNHHDEGFIEIGYELEVECAKMYYKKLKSNFPTP